MTASVRWLVDGMNVIGSRPDGWWRDRPAAMRRLVEQLEAFAEKAGEQVTVVFDPCPGELDLGESTSVRVLVARRAGPDAADKEIARIAAVDQDPSTLRVVTSDAALASQVGRLGIQALGAKRFLTRLADLDA